MSYFESLSECQEPLTDSSFEEDKMEDVKGKVPSSRTGSVLEYFERKESNCKHSKSHSDCDSGSKISNPQSIEDGSHDLVMSQEGIDDLFMITDEECWFDDIT